MSGERITDETLMPKRTTPPITLPEYERLFRTIHAVMASEQGDRAEASLFFAVAGAYLLKRHHKLSSACPVAGVAGHNLGPQVSSTIVFGRAENDAFVSDKQNFHCWIEVDGWIIDLLAPLFNEMLPPDQNGIDIPRFMFQKPALAQAAPGLDTPGAYLHLANDRLTTELMKGFTAKPAYADLVRVCVQWYARPPKKIAPNIRIEDQDGRAQEVSLSDIRLSGAW